MRRAGAAVLAWGAVACSSAAWAQGTPSDYTYATRYDAGRRVVGTIAPDPGGGAAKYLAVRNSYDAAGRLVRVEKGQLQDWQSEQVAPANWSGFTVYTRVEADYDAMGRKVVERAANGAGSTTYTVTQYSYDNQGLLECTAVRMNPAAFGSLPASACSLGVEGSFGPDRIARNEYDAAGQLTKVLRAYGTPLQQDYANYTYSPNGKRTSVRDGNGNLAQMSYDAYDRQSRWTFPSSSSAGQVNAADYEEYGYDANGNRTSLRKRDGRTLTFAYDALNRMTSKIVPNGCAPIQVGMCTPSWALRSVYYGYDLRGLQTYARFDSANGEGVTTTYDGFGQIASSTTAMGGQSRALASQYDADGNRVWLTHPDGTAFYNAYDGLDRVTIIAQSNGVAIANHAYSTTGMLAARSKIGGGSFFEYDGIDRLAAHIIAFGAGGPSYGFTRNPASQIVSRTLDNDAYTFDGYVTVNRSYAVNGLNQYTSAGPASFQYDATGNLYSDGTTGYVYDAENRLVWASASGGTNLAYDPLGRLWQVSSDAGKTQFIYDGDQLSVEYGAGGQILRRYVHDTGDDDPVVWYEGAGLGAPRNIQADYQGSIVSVVDTNGNLIARNVYDEYGITKNSVDGTVSPYGRFGYTGQAWLPELGMYHYKARIYSPTLGRFLQTDPIGYDDQINLYAYVANDPVNGRDPTGTQSVLDGVVDWGKMVASDIVELGKGLAHGDFGWALGGLPPTLGGGAGGMASASLRVASAEVRAEAQVARAVAVSPQARGVASEARVLRSMGLTKNTQAVATREGRAIPDALTSRASVEIKDTARVSATSQVRIQTDAAAASGRQSVLVTGTNTQVTAPAARRFDQIIRRDDLGPR